jgi:hypothetical protein
VKVLVAIRIPKERFRGIETTFALAGRLQWLTVVLPFVALTLMTVRPIVLNSALPAIYDVLFYYFPAEVFRHDALTAGQIPFWNPYHAAGSPFLANPATGVFYPINLLLDLAFRPTVALRSFLLLHLAIAYAAVYALSRRIGMARSGAILSGLTYTFSSYMLARIAWPNYLAAAALIPVALYLAERVVQSSEARVRIVWALAAGACFGMTLLGCQQIAFYEGLALGLYLLTRGPRQRSGAASLSKALVLNVSLVGLILAVGFGLFAVQLLPALRFIGLSNYQVDYLNQVQGGLTLGDLSRLLYGEGPGESISTYIGASTLLVACIGLTSSLSGRKWYFAGLALMSVILSLRLPTWAVNLAGYLPGFAQFVAHWPERGLVLAVLSVSILAGFGYCSVVNETRARSSVRLSWGVGAAVLTVAYVATTLIPRTGIEVHSRMFAFFIGEQACLVLLFLNSGLVDFRKHLVSVAFISLVSIDLALGFSTLSYPFDNFDELFNSSKTQLLIKSVPDKPVGRVVGLYPDLPWDGYDLQQSFTELLTGNSSWVYKLDDAQGYDPLHLRHYWEYLSALNHGRPIDYHIMGVEDPASKLFSLLNVRYLILPASVDSLPVPLVGGIQLSRGSPRADLPVDDLQPIQRISLISALANSSRVDQGQDVAQVSLTTEDGGTLVFPIRAGVDVSEWAIDRPDVQKIVRHGRAPIYGSSDTGQGFYAHSYLATVVLSRPTYVRSLTLSLTKAPEAPDLVWSINTIDAHQAVADIANPVGTGNGYRVWQLKNITPRAFLASETESSADDQAILNRMSSPSFDITRQVILRSGSPQATEIGPSMVSAPANPAGKQAATLVSETLNEVVVHTDSERPSVLVLAENYYPDWRARIDGKDTLVQEADYTFRGVFVPSGQHVVQFYYDDPEFRLGAGISAAVAVLGLVLACLLVVRR